MAAPQVEKFERKPADAPDETRTPPNTLVQQVAVAGHTLGRLTMRPGWRWSEHVKPIVGTDSCQVSHVGYVISGGINVKNADGSVERIKAGDFYAIPPGHDAWNDGDQDFVAIEIVGAAEYARS